MQEVIDKLRHARPNVLVQTIEPLGEGDFCVAYLVNERLVVRHAKHEEGGRALKREACLLPEIAADLLVAVPMPTAISNPDSDADVLAVHEFVPGTALTPKRWGRLHAADRESLGREVGAFLARLHSLSVIRVKGCGLPTAKHAAQLENLTAQLEKGTGGEALDPLRAGLAAAFARYRPGDLSWAGELCVLNGDLSPEHVLFNEESRQLVGVIDWGDAVVGAAPRDFIFLYEDWGLEFLGWALDGYGSGGDRRFLAQVYLFFLADQLDWTLKMALTARGDELRHGVTGLMRGLEDFRSVGV